MLRAAEDGFAEADLLRGDHGYKDRFESIVRPDVRRRVTRISPRVGLAAGRALAARLGASMSRRSSVAGSPDEAAVAAAQGNDPT
jgi:hypothetical protein